jgi:hypothetical protein
MSHTQGADALPSLPAFEQHFSVAQIAKAWGLSREAVRLIFLHEPGVLRLERPESLHKRAYISLRIPQTVALRVYRRMCAASTKIQ